MINSEIFIDYSKHNDQLFKYTSIEYIPSLLENGIYASYLYDLNDPYEAKDISNQDLYRICSLSRSKNANLMWAHYANSHKGCCIYVKFPEYGSPDSVLKRVNYKNQYLNRKNLYSESEIVESLYCKDDKWKDELEVRAVFCKSSYDPNIWNVLDNGAVFLKLVIRGIAFGCMTDIESTEYKESLAAIYRYKTKMKDNGSIAVQKKIMKDNQYRFINDRNYSFDSELKRLGIVK